MRVRSSSFWIALAAIAFMGLGTSKAQASINQLLSFDGETINFADDDNWEFLVGFDENDRSTQVLDVGSVIRGAVRFGSINGQDVSTETGLNYTGVFSLRVRDIINPQDSTGDGFNDVADFLFFEPDPDFGGWLTDIGAAGPALDPVNENVMVRFYEQVPGGNPVAGSDPDDASATFAQGDFYWDLGFADPAGATDRGPGDVPQSTSGEGWAAGGPVEGPAGLDFGATFGAGTSTVTLGTGHFSLSRINAGDNGDYPIVPQRAGDIFTGASAFVIPLLGIGEDDMLDFWGESTVRGSGTTFGNHGWHATSESSFEFVAIPTPTAGLAGLVAFGLMATRRPRRERAEA